VKAEAERALIVTGDACVLVWRTLGSSPIEAKSKQYRRELSHHRFHDLQTKCSCENAGRRKDPKYLVGFLGLRQ
jgi:hypothetical protein